MQFQFSERSNRSLTGPSENFAFHRWSIAHVSRSFGRTAIVPSQYDFCGAICHSYIQHCFADIFHTLPLPKILICKAVHSNYRMLNGEFIYRHTLYHQRLHKVIPAINTTWPLKSLFWPWWSRNVTRVLMQGHITVAMWLCCVPWEGNHYTTKVTLRVLQAINVGLLRARLHY